MSAEEPFPLDRIAALLVNPEGKRLTYEFLEGKPGIMGLWNIGLSCYMNSALNSLYFAAPFYQYFSNLPKCSTKGLTSDISFFANIYGEKTVSKTHLRAIRRHFPELHDGSMGSAYEFILRLLQVLDEEAQESRYSPPPLSPYRRDDEIWKNELERRMSAGCRPLHDIFSVVVEEVLSCQICKISSIRYSYLRSLSLDIPSAESIENALSFPASINTCLSDFLSERSINARCCICKCKTRTIKRSLKHIGTALIIHLQRYHSANPYTEVTVPESLNMSEYFPEAGEYSLCSAILHRGTVLSGHYTCYARTSTSWMLFNDRLAYVLPQWPNQALESSTLFIYVKSAS